MANREIKTTLKLEGEQQYKKAMTDAANSIKVLNSEQKLAAAQFEATGNKEQFLADKTDILKRKIAEQQKAVKAAQEAVTKLKEKGVDPNNKAMQTWQTKLNTSKAYLTTLQSQLNATESELSQQEQAFDNAGQAAIDYGEQLHGIGGGINFQNTIASLESIQGKLNTALNAVTSVIRGIADAELEAANWADGILTEAQKAQLDVETYQSWVYAAQFIDTQVNDIINAQNRLLKQMQSTSDETAETFNRLGVETRTANGALRDTNDVFWDVIDALGKTEDAHGNVITETEKDAIAQELFGKSYRELLPLINAGSEAWNAYVEEGREFALVSEDDVRALGELNDAHDRLTSTMEATKTTLLAKLAPAFTGAANAATKLIDDFNKWTETEEGKEAIDGLASSVGELLGTFTEGDFSGVVNMAADAIRTLNTVLGWIKQHGWAIVNTLVAIKGAVVGISVTKTFLQMLQLVKSIQWLNVAKGAKSLGDAAGASGTGKTASWLAKLGSNLTPAAIAAAYAGTITAPVWGTYAAERRDFGGYMDERSKAAETIRLAGDEKLKQMQDLYAKFIEMAEKGEALNEQDVESIIAARAQVEKITGQSYAAAMDEITAYYNENGLDAMTEYDWEIALGQMTANLGEAIRADGESVGTQMAAGIEANAHVAIGAAEGLAKQIQDILAASYNLGSYVGVGSSGYGGYGRPTYAPYSGMINANIVMDKTVVGRMTAPAVSGTIAAEVRAAGGRP